jgi:predicted metal-dependent HD superfamily phosphohydrolase
VSTTSANLARRWSLAVPRTGAEKVYAEEVYADLIRRWSEPHRHYHTLAHLAQVLSIVDNNGPVALAAWFHDAIYDPRRDDNEEASARLAATELGSLGLPAAQIAEVVRLVRLTATHNPEPGDHAGALLTDADLAILAADPPAYDRYARAIRQEYSHVPDNAFRAGRAAVLRRLRDLPALYRIVPERAVWGARARANLSRELANLSA